MNELIKTTVNENGEILVSGRELHEFLESSERYSKWFERMLGYGFTEGIDYTPYQKVHPQNKQEILDHALKLDMAKEISMLQRNEKGKQARQYFIEIEKRWNNPDMIVKRAYEILQRKVEKLTTQNLMLEQQVNELKPKADYVDTILKNKGLVTITQIAKDYGMSGTKMNELLHELKVQYKQSGQWLLYAKYQNKGYTHSDTVPITRKDGTPDIKMNTKWTQKGRLFLYDLLKRNGILPMIEREFQEAN
ncbi:phage antirepressor KilAC domain-containing protein [Ureibacillus thermosphaericus]|uniref:Anti-repressor protein n=1 Tax=Ureibacillus thermosphaericus TaxID=51173 RepID=A0A840PIH2_URETH|nr:phage antirepressor KilAC domain-containing protein [Ureibacillus thermosphaericus]MBB5148215.1 anti-repressor protein [Ureibacillus thermosphaericus]NKZ31123.1 phage antirepressor Ant [Ureibacillus thermosphaericus]